MEAASKTKGFWYNFPIFLPDYNNQGQGAGGVETVLGNQATQNAKFRYHNRSPIPREDSIQYMDP
jgi:hypothetical protein